MGKTELVVSIAEASAKAGKEPYLFALEAAEGVIEKRIYFRHLAGKVQQPRLDYAGWERGHWKHLDKKHGDEVTEEIRPLLDKMHILYHVRGDFTTKDLSQQLEGVSNQAGMILLDHVHMVEGYAKDEKAEAKSIRLLTEIAFGMSKPVVAASHVRKRAQGGVKSLLPDTEDLHGDSNVYKKGTQLVMFGRDWNGQRPKPHLSPTLVQVQKDRKGRASPYIARVMFDLSESRYEGVYELGRVQWENRKQQWKAIDQEELPYWAAHEARNLTTEEELMF